MSIQCFPRHSARFVPFLLLVCAAAAPPAAAQRREPPRDAVAISQSVRALEYAENGELWAYGATYKARFDADGLMVIPPLGPDAPEDLPLWLSLESITVGGQELELGGAVGPRREALKAEYVRGAGVTERYEVRSEGLEQSFVLHSLPAQRGEIVVRQRVVTDLVPRGDDGGLFFSGGVAEEDGRGLRYGALTAIDARGERVAGEVRLVGATLELRVPADFVATAELPLVLDPLIGGPIDVFLLAGEVGDPDVAQGFWSSEHYFVAFERRWSATDIDVYGQRILDDGSLDGTTVVFEGTVNPVSMNPAVAYGEPSDDGGKIFFVVWQQGSSVSGPFNIVGRAAGLSTGSGTSSTITIANASASETDPAVSYLANAEYTVSCVNRPRFLVVWSRSGIRARAVDITACNWVLTQSSEITISTNANDSLPAVVFLGSVDFMSECFVIWQRFFSTPAPGDHDLHRAVVRNVWPDEFTLVVTVTEAALVTTIGPDETKADAVNILSAYDPSPNDIAVTYERAASSTASDDDIFLARVPVTQVGLGTLLDPPVITPIAVGTGDDDGPALARYWSFEGEQVWLGWISHGSFGFSGVNGVSLQSAASHFVDPNYGLTLCEKEHPIAGAPTGAAFQDVEMANGVGVGIAAFEAIGFGVYAQLMDDYHLGQSVGFFDQWPGCGEGGFASRICPCVEGSNFVHAVERAAPASPAFLIMGFEELDQSCGTCTLIPNPYTGFVVAAGNTSATGVAKVPMSIPSPGTLVGMEFIDQWAIVEPAPACASLGVSLSSAVRFTIDAP